MKTSNLNWIESSKSHLNSLKRCSSLLLILSISLNLTLIGQDTPREQPSEHLASHKQEVPTGWSAINSNLQLLDDRIAQLIPNPSEGTLFFKLTGQGTWDVNQFQWGQWNFPDQQLQPGDSGVLFNPGPPWEFSLMGQPQQLERFSGYLSTSTPISTELLLDVPIGSTAIEFSPRPAPLSNQFGDRYTPNHHFFFGFWAPEFSPNNANESQSIFFLENTEGGFPGSKTNRQTGYSVYINNYIPAFDVDWRLSPIEITFSVCPDAAGSPRNLNPEDYPQSVTIASLNGGVWEIPLQTVSDKLGYLNVTEGSTFNLSFEDGLLISHTSAESHPVDPRNPEEVSLTYSHPPRILTGITPISPPLVHPNLIPIHLAPPCPMHIDFDQEPSDIQTVEGSDIIIPTGVCDLSLGDPRIKGILDQYITFSLYRTKSDGTSEKIVDSVDHQYFILTDVGLTDSGTYLYTYSDSTANPDCTLWNFSLDIWSETFQISVEAKSEEQIELPPEPSFLSLAPTTEKGFYRLNWTAQGRLQEADHIEGPWRDSAKENGETLTPASETSARFFRLLTE